MGVSLSTAKYLAPASFLYDFALQQYGMLSSPNMKDINDKHPAAFTPQPFAIAGFFGPQQILQLLWIRELWTTKNIEANTLGLVPFYAAGNVLIGTWLPFWNSENLKYANLFVVANSLAQLYWVFVKRVASPKTYQGKLTNVVGITFAGIGCLDILHNSSVAYFPSTAPSTLVKALTVIVPAVTSLISPATFGACLVYDLLGLAVGQYQLSQKVIGRGGLTGTGGQDWVNVLVGAAVVTSLGTGWRYMRTKEWC